MYLSSGSHALPSVRPWVFFWGGGLPIMLRVYFWLCPPRQSKCLKCYTISLAQIEVISVSKLGWWTTKNWGNDHLGFGLGREDRGEKEQLLRSRGERHLIEMRQVTVDWVISWQHSEESDKVLVMCHGRGRWNGASSSVSFINLGPLS